MSVGQVLKDKYRLDEEIGYGGFGKVFRATHLNTNKQYAVKIDLKRKGVAFSEAKILSDLNDGVGIPKLHSKGTCPEFSFFVMELLDNTLQHIIKQSGGMLNLETVTKVGTQIINRLEFIHTRGYIHRDIKPSQFLMGRRHKILYLVDFGLAKKYLIFKNHVPFQTHCPRAGNSTFASVNSHMGLRQSRRDDLESVGYMLIYMYKGSLPWQSRHKSNSIMKWQKVFLKKASTTLQDLCQGCPDEIFKFLDYVRNLKFEEKPDYSYLKRLLSSILKQNIQEEKFGLVKSRTSQVDDVISNSPDPRKRKIFSRSRSNFIQKNSTIQKSVSDDDAISDEGLIRFPNTPKSFLELKTYKSRMHDSSSIPNIFIHPIETLRPPPFHEVSEYSPELNAKNLTSTSVLEEKFNSSLNITQKLAKNNSSSSLFSVDFSKETTDSSNTRPTVIITSIQIDSQSKLRSSPEVDQVTNQMYKDRSFYQDDQTPRHLNLPQFKDRNIIIRAKEDHCIHKK